MVDDELPDVVETANHRSRSFRSRSFSARECRNAKNVDLATFTSTWLSVSTKDIDIRHSMYHVIPVHPDGTYRDLDEDDDESDDGDDEKSDTLPYCDSVPNSMRIPDHLEGLKMRHSLHIASESGLKETLLGKMNLF